MTSKCRSILLILLCIYLQDALATETSKVWASSLAAKEVRDKYTSVEAQAKVNVSDGLKYNVVTSWQDNERVVFHRQYPDKIATLGRQGHYFWSFDGKKQKEASSDIVDFILGHQFHSQLLHFDEFFSTVVSNPQASSLCNCWSIEAIDSDKNKVGFHYHKKSMRPVYLIIDYEKHGEVSIQYSDWRKVDKLAMPHHIDILHGERHFIYTFFDIKLNSNLLMKQVSAPYNVLTDEQQLFRLHREMIDAHIESDANIMNHVWNERVVMVNRGNISEMSGVQAAEAMQISLQQRRHSLYIDLQRPIIKISKDRTLGYLTARVKVQGNRVTKTGVVGKNFEFISAWIATFEKIDGLWKLSSNASNFES
jgi:hypothetical protein